MAALRTSLYTLINLRYEVIKMPVLQVKDVQKRLTESALKLKKVNL